jgi:adenylate cyclase
MAAKLVLAEGNKTGKSEVALGDKRVTLGRAIGNDVVLDDREVSKFHAEITVEGGAFTLRDLNSSNGTYVNGKRVSQHRLNAGDVVELGGGRYQFSSAGEAAVSIVPQSPVDRTTVIASSKLDELVPGKQVRDAETLRRVYDRVRTAFDSVQRLLSITDLPALCEQILVTAFQLTNAESGALLLFDDKHKLVPWAHKAAGGPDAKVIVSRTIIDEVLKRKAAVLASDALTDARWGGAQSVVMSGVRSLMCVPLINAERIYGILHVGNTKEVGAFEPSDLELMNGIGAGAGVALSNAFLAHQLAEEARTRESLGRFLSPVLVDQVMQRAIDLKRGGQELEVTVMFADIRGFTSLTERSRAHDVVTLLNEYFDLMVEIVFKHRGILDKFIGDALMAVWGAPVPQSDDAARAVAAALDMQATLQSFNEFRRDRGDEPITIGVGLASGKCVSGTIGARRRMEYTVIGDSVNLASRLAGLAKGGQVLCDEETYRRAGKPSGAKALPAAQVKGKTRPVSVFEIGPVES